MIRIVLAIYMTNRTVFGFGPAAVVICKYSFAHILHLQIRNDWFRKKQFILFTKKKKLTGRSYVLIACIDGQQSTFPGKSAILPSDVMDFAMLPTRRLLAGIIFSAICHVITLYVDHIKDYAQTVATVFFTYPLPPNISIQILHTTHYTFPKVLAKRICLIIRSFFG